MKSMQICFQYDRHRDKKNRIKCSKTLKTYLILLAALKFATVLIIPRIQWGNWVFSRMQCSNVK